VEQRTLKKIAVIPTLLTLGNAVCGFAAIACASKIDVDRLAATEYYFAYSGWWIFAAMAFDALDGYVARLSKVASKFGGELDSLCDAISFGLAPAFLVMRMGPSWSEPLLHRALAGIAVLYMVCALLRLARYNVETPNDPAGGRRFRGLPSPAAAGCLASLAILRGAFQHGEVFAGLAQPDLGVMRRVIELWGTVGGLVVALLMVSRVPYPHLTKQLLRGRRPFSHLIQLIVSAFLLALFRELAVVVVFWAYGLVIPLRYSIARSLRPANFPAAAGPRVDDALRH
jgi:CDP-diacylglycerol--serine O-phosphatidyltransferase